MLIFGHVGITLGIFFGLSIIVPRLRIKIDPVYLTVGALLPDLRDKPLGGIIHAPTFANGRIIGHTLFFTFILLMMGFYLYDKRKDIRVISLATGSFFHLMEDAMWELTQTLFWPIFGLRFPKGDVDNTGFNYYLRTLEPSFTLHFSPFYIPEIFGIAIIVSLTLYWLAKRFGKHKLE